MSSLLVTVILLASLFAELVRRYKKSRSAKEIMYKLTKYEYLVRREDIVPDKVDEKHLEAVREAVRTALLKAEDSKLPEASGGYPFPTFNHTCKNPLCVAGNHPSSRFCVKCGERL